MSARLRVKINLTKVTANSQFLVHSLAQHGISVTGVTKGVRGHPEVAKAMLAGGVLQLADARISNILRLRKAGITCPLSMMRCPLKAQSQQVIDACDISYHSHLDSIQRLAPQALAAHKTHHIMLMVELGDARDGMLPQQVPQAVQAMKQIPGVALLGLATNFACLSGVPPTAQRMHEFTELIVLAESVWGAPLRANSAGGSANLTWASQSGRSPRANNLRLGESILLGTDPISGLVITGLFDDAVKLVVEVIEATPTGALAGSKKQHSGQSARLVLAVGSQDTDILGLGFPAGLKLIGGTSDHIVVHSHLNRFSIGANLELKLSYSALTRAMSAPDVSTQLHHSKQAFAAF